MSVEQLAVTSLVRLYHSAPKSRLGSGVRAEIICRVRCQMNAEGRRTWSIGKLGAGINCAKLLQHCHTPYTGRIDADLAVL